MGRSCSQQFGTRADRQIVLAAVSLWDWAPCSLMDQPRCSLPMDDYLSRRMSKYLRYKWDPSRPCHWVPPAQYAKELLCSREDS